MHIVLSGPYEMLYTTAVDMWSFGCLLLNICIGKTAALKQREVHTVKFTYIVNYYLNTLYRKPHYCCQGLTLALESYGKRRQRYVKFISYTISWKLNVLLHLYR